MPLQGTFDVLDFTAVLRLVAELSVTGRLHVRTRSYSANLFLEEGHLVGADQSEHQTAAASGDVPGRLEEICFEMLEAERGSFEFQPGKPSALPGAGRHEVESVLAQARRRLDEWHRLQEAIPSLDLQPRLVMDLAQDEVTLDQERWRMLTAVDGRRNLRALGRTLNLADFDVCRVVKLLLDDGVVELEGRAALTAVGREGLPVVPTPDTGDVESVSITTPERAEPDPGSADPGSDVPAALEERDGPDQPAEQMDPADARSKARRGRRVVRIRSRSAGGQAT